MCRTVVRVALTTLALFSIALPAAAAQSATGWEELWGPADGSPEPSEVVAGSGGGQTAVAWHNSEGGGWTSTIYLSRRGDSGAWGPAEAVSREDGAAQNDKEGLAVDAHGNTLLAWEGENSAGSDLYIDEVPEGQPARPAIDFWHDVDVNGISQVTVSFDAAGDATVMWRAGAGLYLVRRAAGGSFGSPVRIADEQEREAVGWPSFTSGANGDTVVAADWENGGVAAWLVPHGSPAGSVQVLQHEHEYGGSVRTAMAPDGEAIAAWCNAEYHEEGTSGFDGWLMVATRAPGASSFSAPKRLDQVTNIEGLGLAISPAGEATLLYNQVGTLVAVSRARGGEWRPAEAVGNWATEDAAAAYDAAGNLYVAWHHFSEFERSENGYYAASRTAGGAFDGRSHEVSRAIRGIGWAPAVTVDDSGAFAAWALYGEGRVEAAGPLHPPWEEESSPPLSAPAAQAGNQPPAEATPVNTPLGPVLSPETTEHATSVAGKVSQQSLLVEGLSRALKALSARLRRPGHADFSFRSPAAGLLTIELLQRAHGAGSRAAHAKSLLLGRWALPRAGNAKLRVASSRLAAVSAQSGDSLIATFRTGGARLASARLKLAG
jgi:hypothetical protein